MGVISLRLENSELKRIDDLSNLEHKGRSTVARELIQQGWKFRMLMQYRDGKLSLGSLAKSLDISIAEAIDLLAESGIESPVEYEDYLKGFEILKQK
jgi:fatty acid-binding protein DegV